MDIRLALLKEHSKRNISNILAYVTEDKKRFDRLMELFFSGEDRVAEHAAWVMSYAGQERPAWIKEYLEKMISRLEMPVHDAIKRNVVRVMQDLVIPEHLQGMAFEACMKLLASPEEPIAVKAFSMTVLCNICRDQPELAPEVILEIERLLPYGSAGTVNRGRKIINELKNIMQKSGIS